jgi:hypothetical protein
MLDPEPGGGVGNGPSVVSARRCDSRDANLGFEVVDVSGVIRVGGAEPFLVILIREFEPIPIPVPIFVGASLPLLFPVPFF